VTNICQTQLGCPCQRGRRMFWEEVQRCELKISKKGGNTARRSGGGVEGLIFDFEEHVNLQ